MCEVCGKRVKKTSTNNKYCDICREEKEKERQRIKWHKYKNKYNELPMQHNPTNH